MIQYDFEGNIIKEWINTQEAGKYFGKPACAIVEVCKRKRESAYGYIWRYKEDILNNFTKYIKKVKSTKSIIQYDLDGNFIREWKSQTLAIEKLKIKTISLCLIGRQNQAGGYIWKYKLK